MSFKNVLEFSLINYIYLRKRVFLQFPEMAVIGHDIICTTSNSTVNEFFIVWVIGYKLPKEILVDVNLIGQQFNCRQEKFSSCSIIITSYYLSIFL